MSDKTRQVQGGRNESRTRRQSFSIGVGRDSAVVARSRNSGRAGRAVQLHAGDGFFEISHAQVGQHRGWRAREPDCGRVHLVFATCARVGCPKSGRLMYDVGSTKFTRSINNPWKQSIKKPLMSTTPLTLVLLNRP